MNLNPHQKIEISHDILAREVYARIDATEKMRLKITQFLRDRYDYYVEAGALLDKKDLDYIGPYLEKVELSKAQVDFIRESRRAVGASTRRRQMTVVGVVAVLVVLLGVAAWQWREAKESLDEFQTFISTPGGRGKYLKPVIKAAQQDIYKLRYTEAQQKYHNAANLGGLPEETAKGMMELAFFYSESGKKDEALSLASTALQLLGNTATTAKLAQVQQAGRNYRVYFQQALKQMDAQWYDTLQRRYYPHMIRVNDTASMAQTETTMWQYHLYCEATGQDSMARIKPNVRWGLAGDNPMVMVNWYDAARYANWVNKQMGLDTVYVFSGPEKLDTIRQVPGYRLPHESLWEAAAWGGKKTTYSGSDTLDQVGWYNKNSGSRTRPVKGLRANSFGLYDMTGNVEEWCENGGGSSRGGSWIIFEERCEVTYRGVYYAETRSFYIGFRLTRLD